MSMARAAAASSRLSPNGLARRMIPRQARKPCSGAPVLEDQIAQGGRRRTDPRGIVADAVDGPAGIAAMARRHVVGHGGVLVVAAHARMDGDALALGEQLDGAGGDARVDLDAGEVMRNAIVVAAGLDVIVDADTSHGPLG